MSNPDFFKSSNLLAKGLYILIPIAVISFLFMAMFGQEDQKQLAFTWDKVKPGDKLYAQDLFVTDSSITQFPTYRKVRPVNESDINKMPIPKWQKLKFISQLDTNIENKRPAMISYRMVFVQDDMFKNGTALLGTYIKKDTVTGILKETIYIPLKWYSFKPNLNLCDTNYKFDMPSNYVFADSNIYLKPSMVRLEEPSIFKNKK